MTVAVSIIVPCYNHGHFLDEMLASLPEQGAAASYEVLITNDGSTDESTLRKLATLEAQGLRVIHQRNQGLAAARNTAIAAASGRYLLPLDCDNKLLPTYLTEGVRLLDADPSIDVVYGDPILFGDESGTKPAGDFDFARLAVYNHIDACAIFRKSACLAVGGYDGDMPKMGNEDWELWLRLYLSGSRFRYLGQPCFFYRVSKSSMSATTTAPGFFANRSYVYAKHRSVLARQLLRDHALPRFLRLAGPDVAMQLLLPPPLLPSGRRAVLWAKRLKHRVLPAA